MSESQNKPKQCRDNSRFQTMITLIFAAVIIVLCALLFIYNYKAAYDENTNGGFFSPHDGVVFIHVQVALMALMMSGILKWIWKSRLSWLALAALSVILPILCYQVNYHSFKKDAMLYPLVSEGGALHFMTIHDFDFDGVNDAYDYTGDDVRELSSTDYCTDPYGIVESMDYTIVGKGGKLNGSWCAHGTGGISVYLHKSRVTYHSIRITLHLEESVDAEKVRFYLFGSELEATVEDEHTVSVVMDADTCARAQQTSPEESIHVKLQYVVED